MDDTYTPARDDHFTFRLWTVGNRGRDPFGDQALRAAKADQIRHATMPSGPTRENLAALRKEKFPIEELSAQGYAHERLDQLVTGLLLGVR